MSELTRQERFSMSRQFAKELVAGSIITDAAAQFLALIVQEVHNTKIAPLQAELKRRTTLSAAMELPEVQALVEALREIRDSPCMDPEGNSAIAADALRAIAGGGDE